MTSWRVPIGGGLEYAIGRFMADARFTYRATYYNDLLRDGRQPEYVGRQHADRLQFLAASPTGFRL